MTRLSRPRGDSVQSPLETYLREINETALLNAQEEKQLAYRIEEGDTQARDHMVRANLRLVVNIARSYVGKGHGLQDLIEEGNLGLLRAVEGFDPDMNTRSSTYACYWIKQSSTPALATTRTTLRTPAYMDKMDKREATVLRMRFGLDGEEPRTLKEIGESLGLTRERVRQIESEALAKMSESMNAE